ncbi:hypothetical protein NDU88_005582 [Pleurodeles waltl]|uniref:Uncharacterized protein n=1 Tax=Pleurodeles waltl TaxID=8319 RepID=A0AAV7MAE5_PLEWA|nr:hypothetical protein NDU88_005582 [Pleurodeles waltl]
MAGTVLPGSLLRHHAIERAWMPPACQRGGVRGEARLKALLQRRGTGPMREMLLKRPTWGKGVRRLPARFIRRSEASVVCG